MKNKTLVFLSIVFIVLLQILMYSKMNAISEKNNKAGILNIDTSVPKVSIYLMQNKKMNLSESVWWARNIVSATKDLENVTPEILISLIEVESSFRKEVVSSAGAIGPTQVMPRHWSHMGNIHDPSENIEIGAKILSEYIYTCGDFECGVMMYNIGMTNYNNNRFMESGRVYLHKISEAMNNNSTIL